MNNIDITQLGKLNYKLLQLLNSKLDQKKLQEAQQKLNYTPITPYTPGATQTTYHYSGMEDLGESVFDNDSYTLGDIEQRNFLNTRANNLPTALKWINGLGKMAIWAGTTFLDGTIGLAAGIAQGLYNTKDNDENTGFLSGLWDNPFSKAMLAIQEGADKAMPNYRSEAELNRPWWQNLGTANFWADTVIKNLGFAVGAFYSGALLTKPVTAWGKVGKWMAAATRSARAEGLTNSVVGSAIMALNEGRVEALHNASAFSKAKLMELEAQRDYDLAVAKETYGENSDEYFTESVKIQDAYNQAKDNLEKLRVSMGNATMGLNVPVLLISNMLMFRNALSGGFNTSRRELSKRVVIGAAGKSEAEAALKTAKENLKNLGKDATKAERQAAKKAVKEAEKKLANNLTRSSIINSDGTINTLRHTPRGAGWITSRWLGKGAVEGTEELTQRLVSESTGQYYGLDVMETYKHGKDPKYKKQVADMWESLAKGFDNSFGSALGWEEFFVGAVTGLLGIPAIRSRTYKTMEKNPETGKIEMVEKKRSPVYLAGGLSDTILEANLLNEYEKLMVDYMNQRIQDPKFEKDLERLSAIIQSGVEIDDALVNSDKFGFKNAEFKLMIKDVTYFSQAGRIQDYIDLMNHYLKASPENIKSIVEMTTSIKEDDHGNIVYKDGKPVLVGEFSKYADTETLEGSEDPTPKIVYQNSETNTKEMTEHLDERRKKLVSLAEKVEQVREEIDVKSGGKFSADDLMFMTSLRMTALNHLNRSRSIVRDNKDAITELLNNLSEEEKTKLYDLLLNTSAKVLVDKKGGFWRLFKDKEKVSPTGVSRSRIDARMEEESIKAKKESIILLLESKEITGKNLTDELADLLAAVLTNNSAFRERLKWNVDLFSSLGTSEHILDAQSTIKNIEDVSNNKASSGLYNTAMNMYLNDPDKLQEDLDKADMELYELHRDETLKNWYDLLANASDIKIFNDVMSKIPTFKDVFDALEKMAVDNKNDELNTKIKSYRQLRSAKKHIKNISLQLISILPDLLIEMGLSEQEVQKVQDVIKNADEYNSIMDALDNAQTLEEFENILLKGAEGKKIVIDENGEQKEEDLLENTAVMVKHLNDVYKEAKKHMEALKAKKRKILEDSEEDSTEEIVETIESKKREEERKSNKDWILGDPSKGVTHAILHLRDIYHKNNSLFKGILNGSVKLKGWSLEDINAILEEAEYINNTLKVSNLDENKSNEEEQEKREHVPNPENVIYSSNEESQLYESNPLLDPKRKEAIEKLHTPLIEFLLSKGVYNFIDNGYLGELLVDKNYSSKMPVYYVSFPKEDSVKDLVFLAVEVTGTRFTSSNAISINDKKYLIVGVLSGANDSTTNISNLMELQLSTLDQENLPDAHILANSEGNPITNLIRRIYSGRMAVNPKNMGSDRMVSLNTLIDEWKDEGEFLLGITNENGQLEIVGEGMSSYNNRVVGTNKMTKRYPGTRWLLTREADGLFYPKAIRIESFDHDFFNKNERSAIVKAIKSAINSIVNSKTDSEALKHIRDLNNILYTGKTSSIHFNIKDGKVSDITVRTLDGNEFVEGSPLEMATQLLNVLLEEGYRFQIPKNASVEYINNLLQSNAIITDLAFVHNKQANFVLNAVDEDGNMINAIDGIETFDDIYKVVKGPVSTTTTFYFTQGETTYEVLRHSGDSSIDTWTMNNQEIKPEEKELFDALYETALIINQGQDYARFNFKGKEMILMRDPKKRRNSYKIASEQEKLDIIEQEKKDKINREREKKIDKKSADDLDLEDNSSNDNEENPPASEGNNKEGSKEQEGSKPKGGKPANNSSKNFGPRGRGGSKGNQGNNKPEGSPNDRVIKATAMLDSLEQNGSVSEVKKQLEELEQIGKPMDEVTKDALEAIINAKTAQEQKEACNSFVNRYC